MSKNPYPLVAISLLLSIIGIVSLTVFTPSCTKLDVNEHRSWQNRKDFFDLPANADPVLKKVAAEFERQHKLTGFVNGMVAKDGMPVWERSQITRNKIPTYARGGEEDDVIEVITPLVLDGDTLVHAFFYSKIVDDSVALHLYRANDYDQYPNGMVDSSLVTAERITAKLVQLNYDVFGQRLYRVTDSSLFSNIKPRGVNDSNFLTIKGSYDEENPGSFVSYACWYVRSGMCNCSSLPCDWRRPCPTMYCTAVHCVPIIITSGGGAPIGWPSDPPITTGGGGGGTPGGGNCTGNSNCGANRSLISEGKIPCGGCGPGPIIVITSDDPPVNPPINDTCDIALNLAKKMDTLYIRGKIDSMWNAETGWQNLAYEKGFPVYKNFTRNSTTGVYTITDYLPGTMQGNSNSTLVNVAFTFNSTTTRAAAQGHNHTDSGWAAASAADIFELVDNYNRFNHPVPSMTYEGTFIHAFDNSRYALSFSNIARAQNFFTYASVYLDELTHDWNESSPIGREALRAYQYFHKIDSVTAEPTRSLKAHELSQAAVLSSFDTGIVLLKQDSSGKFKPIVVDIKPDPDMVGQKLYVRKCL